MSGMKYLIKKTSSFLVTLFVISVLAFLSFQVISGDPATAMLGTDVTPERLEAAREQMGLNDPIAVRYVKWLKDFISGDMGTSYRYKMPVRDMIGDKVPVTMALTLLSFFMILAVSLPIGLLAGKEKGSKSDRVFMVGNQIVMAIPSFFLGILMVYLFGLVLKWFTPGKYVSWDKSITGFLSYIIFPAAAIAIPKIAMTVKFLRTSVLTEMEADYVRTAYSKGSGGIRVLFRHVLKNALIPVITFLGMTVAEIVAGSIVVEQVFGVPGMGRLLAASISGRDYPVIQAIVVGIACIVLGMNLAVDFVYRLVDPRIRIENE